MTSGAKRMSFSSQARSIKDYGKTGSQFSLDSACSSGYDSAQPDSRTTIPSDLQFRLSECHDDINIATTAGPHSVSTEYHNPAPIQETSSYTDNLSLLSSTTTLSLYSCATCNDKLSLISFKSTPNSYNTRGTENELEENQENSGDGASQVIHRLKRRSDGWTGPLVKPTDPITSRLKLGRAEAIMRQEVIEIFLEEATSQLGIQNEARKAQSMLCVNSEYLETERIILLAGERYHAYMTEAQQMVSEFGESVATLDVHEETDSIVPCSATLYLAGIKLIFYDGFIRKLKCSPASHHFLCLIKETRSKGITATHIVSLSSTSCTDTTFRIEFNNCFTMPWIQHDFELIIDVYHLILDDCVQPLKQKFMNVINCLAVKTPAALVNRYNPQCLLGSCVIPVTETEGMNGKPEPILSKFQKIGNISINGDCLKQRVYNMEQQSSVVNAVQVCLQAEPDIASVIDNLPLQGYLSFFSGCQWERRWFVLTSHSLSYWLYPDQPEQSEPPISTWNLSECGSSLPELADPDVCAWEHSFVVPLQTGCVRRLLLSAETEAQLNEWMTALNILIICLSTWKL